MPPTQAQALRRQANRELIRSKILPTGEMPVSWISRASVKMPVHRPSVTWASPFAAAPGSSCAVEFDPSTPSRPPEDSSPPVQVGIGPLHFPSIYPPFMVRDHLPINCRQFLRLYLRMWDRRANPDPSETQVLPQHPRFSWAPNAIITAVSCLGARKNKSCCAVIQWHWFCALMIFSSRIDYSDSVHLAQGLPFPAMSPQGSAEPNYRTHLMWAQP
ncbi:hypothetical protein C8Q73DRAFT_207159 [Cubamyces lactineus]|nr:hypothetical protein C8Q73DRAFT_207159 [Cubamyces lactineus]